MRVLVPMCNFASTCLQAWAGAAQNTDGRCRRIWCVRSNARSAIAEAAAFARAAAYPVATWVVPRVAEYGGRRQDGGEQPHKLLDNRVRATPTVPT
eukprot:6188457-Pleurochrysis_carterae.AAC.5